MGGGGGGNKDHIDGDRHIVATAYIDAALLIEVEL